MVTDNCERFVLINRVIEKTEILPKIQLLEPCSSELCENVYLLDNLPKIH